MVEPGSDGVAELHLYQRSMLGIVDAGHPEVPLVLARGLSRFELAFWEPRRGEFANEWLQTNQLPQAVVVTLGSSAGRRGLKELDEVVSRTVRLSSSTVPGAGAALP